MSRTDESRVGSVLDQKWTLERLLGSGAMGAVYEARHRNGARAAVKLLHRMLAREPEVRERFLREGYAANKVEHKGAVRVLDDDVVESGPDEGTAYLVMELLEGESLDERQRKSPPLGEHELLEIAEQVLDVLAVAHTNGVVHRDLKPENLFLSRDEGKVRVKILDFGLARISDLGHATNAGKALGTPAYMSPEQALGKGDEIDGRTDLFALGATIFRVLSGRRVHEGDNAIQVLVKMQRDPAPKLADVFPRVSPEVAAIVDRALAFAKADRYPTAAAMLAHVRAAREVLGYRGSSKLLVAPAVSAPEPSAEPESLASADVETVSPPTVSPPTVSPPKDARAVAFAETLVAVASPFASPPASRAPESLSPKTVRPAAPSQSERETVELGPTRVSAAEPEDRETVPLSTSHASARAVADDEADPPVVPTTPLPWRAFAAVAAALVVVLGIVAFGGSRGAPPEEPRDEPAVASSGPRPSVPSSPAAGGEASASVAFEIAGPAEDKPKPTPHHAASKAAVPVAHPAPAPHVTVKPKKPAPHKK